MEQILQTIFTSPFFSRYPENTNLDLQDSVFHADNTFIFQSQEEIAIYAHNPTFQNYLCIQDFVDLVFVYHGNCTCKFYQNTSLHIPETVYLPESSFCIIPPGVKHSFQNCGSSQILHIFFLTDSMRSHYSDLISANNTLLLFFSNLLFQKHYWNYLYFSVTHSRELNSLLYNMCREYQQKNAFYQNMLYYSAGILFTLMERCHLGNICVSPSNPIRLVRYDQIYSYICDNYSMTSSSEIAEYFHISQSYLCKLFHDNGTTVSSVIKEIRIQHAKSLLEQSDLSVQNIAELVGYHDITYFIRLFKQYFSVTPYQYRKKYQSAKTFS